MGSREAKYSSPLPLQQAVGSRIQTEAGRDSGASHTQQCLAMTLGSSCKASKYFDNLSPTGVSCGEQMDTVGATSQRIPQEETLHQWRGFCLSGLWGREADLGAGLPRLHRAPQPWA